MCFLSYGSFADCVLFMQRETCSHNQQEMKQEESIGGFQMLFNISQSTPRQIRLADKCHCLARTGTSVGLIP